MYTKLTVEPLLRGGLLDTMNAVTWRMNLCAISQPHFGPAVFAEAYINAIKTGRLGPIEVLVSIDELGLICIWRLDEMGPRPWLVFHIASSSWGVDIHSGRALVAVSSNNYIVSLFDLSDEVRRAVSGSESSSGTPTSDHPPSSRPCFSESIRSLVDPGRLVPYGRLVGHKHNIPNVTFSPCGDYLASSSVDRWCIVWAVDSGDILQRRTISNECHADGDDDDDDTGSDMRSQSDNYPSDHTDDSITGDSQEAPNSGSTVGAVAGSSRAVVEGGSDEEPMNQENPDHRGPSPSEISDSEDAEFNAAADIYADELSDSDEPSSDDGEVSTWSPPPSSNNNPRRPPSRTSRAIADRTVAMEDIISESDFNQESDQEAVSFPWYHRVIGPRPTALNGHRRSAHSVDSIEPVHANLVTMHVPGNAGDGRGGYNINSAQEKKGGEGAASLLHPYLILFGTIHGLSLLDTATGHLSLLYTDPYLVAKKYLLDHTLSNPYWRLNMMEWLPEISAAVVACQGGKLALTRVLWKKTSGVLKYGFHVEQYLPIDSDSNAPLLGMCIRRQTTSDPYLRAYILYVVLFGGQVYTYRISLPFKPKSSDLSSHM
ncbi:hypothetical protein H4R33_005330 [Dimargaris cristalligena]|nr:hypothetical protein H4R33_005330 [Dimargaris cristalligena]